MLRNRAKRKYGTVAREIQFSEFYRTAIKNIQGGSNIQSQNHPQNIPAPCVRNNSPYSAHAAIRADTSRCQNRANQNSPHTAAYRAFGAKPRVSRASSRCRGQRPCPLAPIAEEETARGKASPLQHRPCRKPNATSRPPQ